MSGPTVQAILSAVEEAKPFTGTTAAIMWLKSIDVMSSTARGAVVAFGDSITQGSCATRDGYDRWSDWLALRLEQAGRPMAVVNEGIGGNTVLAEHPEKARRPAPRAFSGWIGMSCRTRASRTSFSSWARTTCVAARLRRRYGPGMEEIITRVKARKLTIIGATAIPRHNNPSPPWDETKTKNRNELNAWIRTKAPFDGVLDFDAVMRDPVKQI